MRIFRCKTRFAFLLGLSLLSALPGLAAVPAPTAAAPATAPANSPWRIFLLTFGPGDAVYEQFGHNAILVENERTRSSEAFNYGLFDWSQDDFIPRFIQGRMLYWMEPSPGPQTLNQYVLSDRSIIIQELNFSPIQRQRLVDFLNWNAAEPNNQYRYDYYADNCSTRVRDALDKAADGQIRQQLQSIRTGVTYRWHTRRICAYNPLLYTALDAVLGPYVDRELSAWDESFLPHKLQEHLRTVTIDNAAGQRIPLVMSERTLYTSSRPPQRTEPPNWLPIYLLIGSLMGTGFFWLARRAPRHRWSRRGLMAVSGAWLLLIALSGSLFLFIWLFTDHASAYRNENLLQFNPLALPLAILVPLLARRARSRSAEPAPAASDPARQSRPAPPWINFTWILSLLLLAGSLAGLLIQTIPGFNQVNGQMIAFLLPAHLGLAMAVWSLRARAIEPPIG